MILKIWKKDTYEIFSSLCDVMLSTGQDMEIWNEWQLSNKT